MVVDGCATPLVAFLLCLRALNRYVGLTQMKFVIPPKNPQDYGREIVAPMQELNDKIVRGFQELES